MRVYKVFYVMPDFTTDFMWTLSEDEHWAKAELNTRIPEAVISNVVLFNGGVRSEEGPVAPVIYVDFALKRVLKKVG